MAPVFLPSIDIESTPSQTSGLDLKTLSFFKHVYAQLDPQNLPYALKHLKRTIGTLDTYFDVTSLPKIDDVITLLDTGAAVVFVTQTQKQQLSELENIDLSRLVIANATSQPLPISGPVYISNVADFAQLEKCIQSGSHDAAPSVFVRLHQHEVSRAADLARANAIPIIPAASLTLEPSTSRDSISALDLLLSNVTSDRPDGLLTTLVVDGRGTALGLVYSSKESVAESLRTGTGVYQSRKRGLWYKGATSGDVQELLNITFDCDSDCLLFSVVQKGKGFCHLATATCFGPYRGLSRLQQTLQSRKASAPPKSYTARLFSDGNLLNAKIQEEANELCEAAEKDHIAFEAADLLYFAMTKCVAAGVSLEDVERNLDAKSLKVKRRKGDAKSAYSRNGINGPLAVNGTNRTKEVVKEAASVPKSPQDPVGTRDGHIKMRRYDTTSTSAATIEEVLKRPSQRSTDTIMTIVKPIIEDVRDNGDKALLSYTHKFEKATSLTSPVLHAPFSPKLMQLPSDTIAAIDVAYENIRKFHAAQKDSGPLRVETMPGVVCSRFSRPIERVGLYVPGGTAVLPSTALMLGVPAMVAGCKTIILASPPRSDGSITPEIVYIAHKIGAKSIILAGGAQAVAAMAYGTASISKVDKILGPGNQFVTAAKMHVANDTTACVSIDMPAGPSEVLVVADATSNPAFVASDLLSQAEHGVDSQVILLTVSLSPAQLDAIEHELDVQANALPRVAIVRGAIEHSVTLATSSIEEAMALSNQYAPEHLILQVADADAAAEMVENAGSVFIGQWTPESVGDYAAGVNHSLPTYGYARQYSGVNLASYVKHITSSRVTQQGLRNVGGAVMKLAEVEELEAHRRAVSMRLAAMDA